MIERKNRCMKRGVNSNVKAAYTLCPNLTGIPQRDWG
jgi:hypothetical protein